MSYQSFHVIATDAMAETSSSLRDKFMDAGFITNERETGVLEIQTSSPMSAVQIADFTDAARAKSGIVVVALNDSQQVADILPLPQCSVNRAPGF